jgi:membrane-associated phospholipid phosphatase
VAQSSLADTWFASGNSFPSGHVAFFAGLTLPIVALYPRLWVLLAVPLLVATQRVLAADHYLSDVTASFGIAVATTALLLRFASSAPSMPLKAQQTGQ